MVLAWFVLFVCLFCFVLFVCFVCLFCFVLFMFWWFVCFCFVCFQFFAFLFLNELTVPWCVFKCANGSKLRFSNALPGPVSRHRNYPSPSRKLFRYPSQKLISRGFPVREKQELFVSIISVTGKNRNYFFR